jgi:hypothetical protein
MYVGHCQAGWCHYRELSFRTHGRSRYHFVEQRADPSNGDWVVAVNMWWVHQQCLEAHLRPHSSARGHLHVSAYTCANRALLAKCCRRALPLLGCRYDMRFDGRYAFFQVRAQCRCIPNSLSVSIRTANHQL